MNYYRSQALAEYQRDCDAVSNDYRHLATRSATARKNYRCAHCGGPIKVGEQYFRLTYLHDGGFHCDRTHTLRADCLSWDFTTA